MIPHPQPLLRSLAIPLLSLAFCFGGASSFAEKKAASAETLKALDRITIVVFEEPTLSGEFSVSKLGSVNHPLLGQIPVEGLAPQEVAAKIEELLEKDYIRDANVSVDLVGRKASSVTVIGQVRRPGLVEYPAGGGMDLFTAIASAGGPAEETADTSRIEIQRRSGDSIETIVANLEKQKTFALTDTDTVIVPSKTGDLKLYTVLGQVTKPGTYPMIPGRDLDILSAIAMAGGVSQMANPKKVTVRSENGQSQVVNVDRMQKAEIPSLILKPGDTIYVPESWF